MQNQANNMKKLLAVGAANQIKKEIGRPLSQIEATNLLYIINNIPEYIQKNKNVNLSNYVVDTYLNKYEVVTEKVPIDLKDYHMFQLDKSEYPASPIDTYKERSLPIDENGNLTFRPPFPLQNTNLYNLGLTQFHYDIANNSIKLDSRFRDLTTGNTSYRFNLQTTQSGADSTGIRLVREVRNIIEIDISPFEIPYRADYLSFYKKITLGIREFESQSMIQHNNTKVHFIFKPEILGSRIKLFPVSPPNFIFATPYDTVDTITLVFSAVDTIMDFDPDRGSTTSFTSALPPVITMSAPHNLSTGDLVYFSNFTGTSQNAFIQRESGFMVTVTGASTFTIVADLSAEPAVPQPVAVYYGSKRIIIPFTMRSLSQRVR